MTSTKGKSKCASEIRRFCSKPGVRDRRSAEAAQVLDTNNTRSKACDIPSKHDGRILSDAGGLLTGASMADLAATVAFGLLIGGQFLDAIYLLSNRSTLYPEDQLFRRRSTIRDATILEGGAG